ncbi:hypothetical protein [Burkholderia paludis]|nr:hypothetical protein [Burkholderia paludis]
MQYSLYRILVVTALAWQLTVPAEMEASVGVVQIADAEARWCPEGGFKPA